MIEVHQLTKRYARHTAVRDITFSVERGEIVGFLGPNGAGKTTTLRMLTGYLPPTSGSARIAGFDIFRQSIEARRKIGYMPENVPLYEDMRVREYLKFRAQLKGLDRRRHPPPRRRGARHLRPGNRAPQDDQDPLQRLPPARRSGRCAGPRSRTADSRRTDQRPRSQPDPPDPRTRSANSPNPTPCSFPPTSSTRWK